MTHHDLICGGLNIISRKKKNAKLNPLSHKPSGSSSPMLIAPSYPTRFKLRIIPFQSRVTLPVSSRLWRAPGLVLKFQNVHRGQFQLHGWLVVFKLKGKTWSDSFHPKSLWHIRVDGAKVGHSRADWLPAALFACWSGKHWQAQYLQEEGSPGWFFELKLRFKDQSRFDDTRGHREIMRNKRFQSQATVNGGKLAQYWL